jgi:hypothetical protein
VDHQSVDVPAGEELQTLGVQQLCALGVLYHDQVAGSSELERKGSPCR